MSRWGKEEAGASRTLRSGSKERVRLGDLDDIDEQLLAEKDVRVGWV